MHFISLTWLVQLKPQCVELIQVISSLPQRPSAKREIVQSLTKLLGTLKQLAAKPDILDAKLAEFVFVPISHVLRSSRTVSAHALELSLECISILLRTGWKGNLSPALSGQLLILFTFLANPSSAENGIPATSEELQAAAFKCMAELLAEMSRTSKGKSSLTETGNIPTLGKAVLVMLDSITDLKSNSVRLQALAAVQALASGIDDLDALASFLPRMVSSLTKLLTPSSTKRASFRVIERGLDTMSLLLLRVLSDRQTTDLPSQDTGGDDKDNKRFLRTASWLQATTTQIKIALANILKLRNHDKKEVRYALLQLCLRIIRDCRKSLSECIGMVTETMVTLAGRGGENDTIENDLKTLLYTDHRLSELLRDSLNGWVISLPRFMQSKDDASRRQIIHQISIAVRLLNGEETDLTIIDELLAGNLRDGLSNIMGDSNIPGALVDSTAPMTIEMGSVLSSAHATTFQPLALRLKGQEEMMKEFRYLLQELAKSKSALTVARDLVNDTEFGPQETQLASLWLSVNLLKDMVIFDSAVDDFLDLGTSNIQNELLDTLYNISLARLTKSPSDTETHWHFQALSLEVIALQASRYKTDFRGELVDVLYPALHILGTPNQALQNHAMSCLNILAESCGFKSVSDLIVSNVDYIINAVGLQLNYHDISPQAPQVLLMMMRLCGPSLLPYLDDLVASMFSALERFHGYPKLVELLFSALGGMVEEGVKIPQLMITADDSNIREQSEKPTTMSAIVNALKEMETETRKNDEEHEKETREHFPRRPWKDPTKDPEDTNAQETPHENEEDDQAVQPPDPLPPAPRIFDIILKISELTQHYLTSSSSTLRSSLLALLHTTIPALAKHENSFLPLINTLWPVLLPRIDDPEAYVVSNALDIVSLMCIHAGNFMKGRIEGAWSDLQAVHRRTLKKTDNRSNKNLGSTNLAITHKDDNLSSLKVTSDREPSYRPELYVSAPTRMISNSLNHALCAIAKHVIVREEFFDDILDMLEPILERSNVRESLEYRNTDAVWLRLLEKNRLMASDNNVLTQFRISVPEISQGLPRWNFVRLQ
ncbi:hypothetical protein K504DRAFT_365914 [Pleomassaria siparia CBS 279.74]|uniref:ARM repeat-containing protein n=1 Tax=Pleomassaria siparia CBS 279.74 TaxID=1314801 RepID=A0A6G1KQV0_9PLEO|nr:hypothetical protein K504DRAFT_365914 [Pleomassaria siparia CBS 279.74]